MWAAAGDVRFKQRADYLEAELKTVQDEHGDGFAGALQGVREAFADIERRRPLPIFEPIRLRSACSARGR